MEIVSASSFKATCLKILDDVAERGTEVLITKRGRPVARLVPVDRLPPRSILGALAGMGQDVGDIVSSTLEWSDD